ncbi:hypothetical protein ACLKA6_009552 [Drosophila palustris]
MNKVLILLLWIGLFSLGAQAKFKTLNCELHDKDVGIIRLCKIKAVSRTKNLINIIFDLFQTVKSGVMLQVQYFKRVNGWRPFLYNFTVDACQFLKKPNNLIVRLAYEYLKPFTNLNHTCPYKAGSTIIIKNFDLDVDQFRSRYPIDNGEYALHVSLYYDNILKASVKGSIYHFNYKDQ